MDCIIWAVPLYFIQVKTAKVEIHMISKGARNPEGNYDFSG